MIDLGLACPPLKNGMAEHMGLMWMDLEWAAGGVHSDPSVDFTFSLLPGAHSRWAAKLFADKRARATPQLGLPALGHHFLIDEELGFGVFE